MPGGYADYQHYRGPGTCREPQGRTSIDKDLGHLGGDLWLVILVDYRLYSAIFTNWQFKRFQEVIYSPRKSLSRGKCSVRKNQAC
jgi:hypothetical protein